LVAVPDSQNQAEYKGRVSKLSKLQFGHRKSPECKCVLLQFWGRKYYNFKSFVFSFIVLVITAWDVIVSKDQILSVRCVEEGAKAPWGKKKLPTFFGNLSVV